MAPDPNPGPDDGATDDEALDPNGADAVRLAAYATELADAVDAALAGWVVRCVQQRLVEAGREADEGVLRAAGLAGEQARAEVGAAVRALLAQDIDDQRTNPLSLLRGAVRYPTSVLLDAGVPAVGRDADARRLFPDDHYDLTPGSFADLDPALTEPGVHWGAAKAHVHLARRKAQR